MAVVETADRKKEMIERSVKEFQKLDDGDKMLILGYMLRIQQENQEKKRQ